MQRSRLEDSNSGREGESGGPKKQEEKKRNTPTQEDVAMMNTHARKKAATQKVK